jgi:MFS family permease
MPSKRTSYSRLAWRRLGNWRAINFGYFAFGFIIYALLTLAFDAVITANFTWLWLVSFAVTYLLSLLPLATYLIILRYWLPSQKSAPWINLWVVALAGIVKNSSVPVVAQLLGLQTTNTMAFRIVGGAFTGVSLFVIYSTATSARLDHLETMRRLRESEAELLGYRESANEILQDEQIAISERIRRLLMPRLTELLNSLSKAGAASSLAERLQNVIDAEVRPLNAELANEAKRMATMPARSHRVDSVISSFPERIEISTLLRPNTALPMMALSYLLFAFIIYPDKTTLYTDVGIVVNWGLLWLIKISFRFFRPVRTNLAVVFLAAASGLAVLPTYIYLASLQNTTSSWILSGIYFVSGITIPTSFALSSLLDHARTLAESQLRQFVDQIQRENKLFEQALWLSKNAWTSTLHGTVQSALTAALMRSKMGPLDKQTIALIESDLLRAVSSLSQAPTLQINPQDSFNDLLETWAGIAEIEFTIGDQVADIINRTVRVQLVLNEVCKELVSNAIRHGGADRIKFEILSLPNQNLSLVCTNNGSKPSTSANSSLGTEMLSQLLIEPKLRWDASIGLTVFSAQVPVPDAASH